MKCLNMTEKEKQFEARLDSLSLLKGLLIESNEFDIVAALLKE